LVGLAGIASRPKSILLKAAAAEGKQGGSNWEPRVSRKWVARVGSAPRRNPEGSVQLVKGSRSTNPSLGL
ncbi:hypothetical protein T4B_14666, partial [Trichinella pseudospiralis]